ncbi:MAG: FAD-dependent oxidoreductase [Clostridiales bacterium]|nr:FAD-dependent oxidoreductase [Clostridiales bacterium]
MKVIVIGNGLAGTMAAKTLRELDSGVEVHVYAEEKYPYYPRPNLIEYIAGRLPYERLFAFSEDWHIRQNIGIYLGKPVRKIHPPSRKIEIESGKEESYDALLVANGASSFIPAIRGSEKRGVFTLRTLDDAQAILDYLKDHSKVVVIGGGLLGLEIARALKSRGAEVEVVEFFDRLLPRQLDQHGASLLKKQIEGQGIRVRLGVATEEIVGQKEVTGLRFKGGEETVANLAVIAAGVRPNLGLLKEAGLTTDKGLLVDDFLRTNLPQIFGAGDSIQHDGKVYGIIPASFDQARTVAYNILGEPKKYEGTVPSNTLKVAGIYMTSVGTVNPEGLDYQEIRTLKEEEGVYKKIVLLGGAMVGAIWMGTKKGANEIVRAVTTKRRVSQWVNHLLEDTFDFSVL